jgi:hypothetical protein
MEEYLMVGKVIDYLRLATAENSQCLVGLSGTWNH